MNNPFDRFMRNYLFFIILILFLNGCKKPSAELLYIEDLLKTKPDSALKFLENKGVDSYKSDLDKAYYGLLLSKAIDKNNKRCFNDSLLNQSILFYKKEKIRDQLALCYFYKARFYKFSQKFDSASQYHIKALNILENSKEYYYIGKIYSDLGDICSFQSEYDEALKRYLISSRYFQKANDTFDVKYKNIDFGRIYRFKKDNIKAHRYYLRAIEKTNDSLLIGTTFQEMGMNYYKMNKKDSAEFYLKESLRYPYNGTSYAIRHFSLGEIYLDAKKYKLAINHALTALKYATSFYNQRDCYRILANSEYYLGDFGKMGEYLWKYQEYADSIRVLENQTKSVVIEDFNNKSEETIGAKNNMILNTIILLLLTLFVSFLAYYYYLRTGRIRFCY